MRTLLALAVVLGHTHSAYVLVGGRNAVQMFYVISGFLISYVLVERRAYASPWVFYANRYLRLYPIYLVVGLLTLVGCATALRPGFFEIYQQAPWSAVVWLFLSNLLIVGQDWLMFAGVQAHQLVFAVDFRTSEVPLWKGLLAPQAWTLGVELSFYAIAPFIVHRRGWLWCLLAVSMAWRIALIRAGIGMNDPWDYRFFPTELALFILGALAHQILRPWYSLYLKPQVLACASWVAFVVMLLAVLAYPFVPMPDLFKSALLFALLLPSLPLLFVLQSGSKVDRVIGELSYPIYICHWLVIEVSAKLFDGRTQGVTFLATVVVASLLSAYGLNRWVGEPVERWRDKLRAQGEGRSA
ncbi:acyltransferase [Aquabacterium sp. G14]|uniref:acyltransferase family protein n=1 Tax=Aquabacterium sp. G14 TaxID=3130164 RepID=UPI0030B38768